MTARLETDFRRPVPSRLDPVHPFARADAVRGRKIYCSAEGRLERPGRAAGVSPRGRRFVQVKLDHFTTHGRPEEIEGGHGGTPTCSSVPVPSR